MYIHTYILDKKVLQTVSNHPVHILNNDGDLSPSSFIPFCSFGEEFIGTKIDEFNIPVCNIFKPKHYFNQLCYETDLQKLKDNNKMEKQLERGFTLVLDYNEEREIGYKISSIQETHLKTIYSDENDISSFSIFVHTISTEYSIQQVVLLQSQALKN